MRTKVSQSKIYALLKQMYEEKWVHRYYDTEVEKLRNTIDLHSGEVFLDKSFDDLVVSHEKEYISQKLFPLFFDYVNKVIEDFGKDLEAKKWLPQRKVYCKECGKAYEAEEFFNSLLDIATAEFLESKEYFEFLKKKYYAEEIEEES